MQPPAKFFEHEARIALLAVLIFSGLSIWAAVTSDGFLEADGCTHYLYARGAWHHPYLLVNVWGRPVCTGVYAIPAHFAGRLGVRFTSLLMALGIAVITWRIAFDLGWPSPLLGFIFVLGQPLLFLHSFSELTELPFALLMAVAFWAYVRRQWFWMAVVMSLMPLSRPEGFGFLILAATALLAHRRWWWLPVLLIPLWSWDYSGWVLYGRAGPWWKWLPENWPYAATSLYDRGTLLHFIGAMPAFVGPLLFPALILGGWLLRRGGGGEWNHRRRCQWLILALPLSILIVHTLLYWQGKMASNGELRYMLVVAPFWALLGARGWAWAFEHFRWNHVLAWAATAAGAPALLNLIWGVVPVRSQPDWLAARQIAIWYCEPARLAQFPNVLAAHPGIAYELDTAGQAQRELEWRKDLVDARQPGTILIWDKIYGIYNSDARRSVPVSEIIASGWKELFGPWNEMAGGWRVFVGPANQ